MSAAQHQPTTPQTKLSIEQVDHLNSTLMKSPLPAHARLIAENGNEFYMNELEVEIGREAKLAGPRYFCVAESNTISKNHVRVWYEGGEFWAQNLSKNKIYVNFKELVLGGPPERLHNMSPIMISKVKLYFQLPHNRV